MSGRALLFIVLVGLLLTAGLLFYLLGPAAWRLWNIPVMMPSFADVRSILSGLEAQRLGLDPLFQNPADPFGRVMAYPRLWLALGVLPLSTANTAAAAAVEFALFLVGLFIFSDGLERGAVPWILAVLVSPAAMLCYERGNTDLVVFFLLTVALAGLPNIPVASVLLTELAAFLKIYPLLALGMLLRLSKRTAVIWLSGALTVFGLYLAFAWRDVQQVLLLAPKGVGFNYGATVAGVWLLDLTGSSLLAHVVIALAYIVAYVVLVLALSRSRRGAPLFEAATNPRWLDAFRVGALLYIGTFLQGNTWNYRLIFLVFLIPQLVEWTRSDAPGARRSALFTLTLALLTAWAPLLGATEPPSPSLPGVLLVLADELSNWGLLFVLSYLFFATLPVWIRDQVALFFRKYSRATPARA